LAGLAKSADRATTLPSLSVAAHRLDVLIASPEDASRWSDAVQQALHSWNDHRADAEEFILRPRRSKIASVPIWGRGDGQTVINSQLVDTSDIVIAIFYYKLGSSTRRAVSRTAEEVARAVNAGKPVHIYFAQYRFHMMLTLMS
jgi:hypothetical protein